MSKVVHVQTVIQTVFGIIDDHGNVIPQQPVVLQLVKFSPESFAEAFTAIARVRDETPVAPGTTG